MKTLLAVVVLAVLLTACASTSATSSPETAMQEYAGSCPAGNHAGARLWPDGWRPICVANTLGHRTNYSSWTWLDRVSGSWKVVDPMSDSARNQKFDGETILVPDGRVNEFASK